MDTEYIQFIADLKRNIIQSRYVAARLANKEQLLLYFKTGRMLSEKIAAGKWGAGIIEQIAKDLQKQLPGLRGFSYSNLMNMRQFFHEYQLVAILQSATGELGKNPEPIGQWVTAQFIEGFSQPVTGQFAAAQLQETFFSISFTHHILILNKCKDQAERLFYIHQASSQFWSVQTLEHHIKANLYEHQGNLPNNFNKTLPEQLKPSALKMFQDEYLMDFIVSDDTDDERVLENKVVFNIKNFIMRMGQGFAFIGNQYRLEVGGEEFFVDLLFFNRPLQCLVAFELKRGKFKPGYAGQLNFYLNVLDEKVKLESENPSIGIVLCKEKNNTVVEFAVKTIDKAMGVATYRTTKDVPKEMKEILPNVEDLATLL